MEKIPQPVKVALLTLVILLCVDISLLFFRGSFEKLSPKSPLTPIYSYLDLNNPENIKIIVLGSSRTFSCIKKDLLAKLSGINESNILNLHVDGGSCWEELSICRKYPKLFASSPLVILEIGPWMFNKYYFSNTNNLFIQPGFFTWATFQDRLNLPDVKEKYLLLFDYFWPVSERRSIDEWVGILYSLVIGRPPTLYDPDEIPGWHYNLSDFIKVRDHPGQTVQYQTSAGLNNYTFAEYKAEYLRSLIHLIEYKSKNIVLLQPPLRNAYFNIVYNNNQYLKGDTDVIKFIHSLESERVHSIIWQAPEDCGMNDSVLVDYGHFSVNGAYLFTQILFNKLKGLGLLNLDTVGGTGTVSSPEENILRLEETLKTNPNSINVMQSLAIAYSNKGYYKKALIMLNRMVGLQPDNANVYYNVACIKAKQGKGNESIGYLKMAIVRGFKNKNLMLTDKDLDNIKESPEFKELLKM